MRIKDLALLSLLVVVTIAMGCGDTDPQAPQADSPAPAGWDFVCGLIDWNRPDLAEAQANLAAGDSLSAAEAVLTGMLHQPHLESPHMDYNDPLPEADRLMAGILTLPTHPTATLPEDPTWAEDPFGDINWRYQYHTLRWTTALFQAFQVTENRDYLDRILFLLEDYMRDNLLPEPPSDMTWYDMSASIRTEHLIYYWRELLLAGEADVDLMISVISWLQAHGEKLTNEIYYNESSNHGTFHNRSLLIAGLAAPLLHSASNWFDTGFDRLETQILGMVSPYGVQVEQSPSYHFSQCLLALGIRDILESQGLGFSAPTEQLLELMPVFGAHIIQPDGKAPMFSDSPARLNTPAYRGWHPELEYSLSQGSEGEMPSVRYLSYPETGYVICRSGWGQERAFQDESMAVFDTGPKGGWHGHYDALTFTFFGHGEKLIVDSGYYTFNAGEWRDYFLSPSAHNVLIDASALNPTWNVVPQRLTWRTGADWAYQSALVDLKPGRSWVRHFVFLDPDEILLLDFTFGDAPADLRLLLHFAPGATSIQEGSRLRLSIGGAQLDVFPAFQPALELIEGQDDPTQGWYSPSYGEREANLVASYGGDRGLNFMTLLHAHEGDDPLVDFQLLGGSANEYYRFLIERSSGSEHVTVWTATGEVERWPVLN